MKEAVKYTQEWSAWAARGRSNESKLRTPEAVLWARTKLLGTSVFPKCVQKALTCSGVLTASSFCWCVPVVAGIRRLGPSAALGVSE